MALTDYKITGEDVRTKGVVGAPDKLRGTAAENKELFDRLIREVVAEKINALIDGVVEELLGKMDAPEVMGAVGQYLRIGENGVEWDTPSGSGDMLQAVYDRDRDGVVNKAEEAESCSGNANTATKLQTGRSVAILDATGEHSGQSVEFDGTKDIVLKIPTIIEAKIIGDVEGEVLGNAETATKLQSARNLVIQDYAGAGAGTPASFDGTKDVVIRLPSEVSLMAIIAGAGLCGTSYPANPKEGQLFFLEE